MQYFNYLGNHVSFNKAFEFKLHRCQQITINKTLKKYFQDKSEFYKAMISLSLYGRVSWNYEEERSQPYKQQKWGSHVLSRVIQNWERYQTDDLEREREIKYLLSKRQNNTIQTELVR